MLANFSNIKFFTEKENWGDASRMSNRLLTELDEFRDYLGVPVTISCGTQGTHVKDSYHYKGVAVDLVAPKFTGHLLDLFLIADRFNFGGIGLYPDWHFEGRKCGGLHLDIRTGNPGRWLKLSNTAYLALDHANLKRYNII